jgi:hypothetical protein
MYTMYFENPKAHLLVKVLRKDGWRLLQDNGTQWLILNPYHIRLEKETFTLLANIKSSNSLVKVKDFTYGRRQSQYLKRVVKKHKRETERCMNTNSYTKGEQKG